MDIQPCRRSIRLPQYNYSTCGAYFVTICTHERKSLFGDIRDGKMRLNEMGKIMEKCWLDIKKHCPTVELDEFSIMPNHMHGIILITDINIHTVGAQFIAPNSKTGVINHAPTTLGIESKNVGAQFIAPAMNSLGNIIRSFKAQTTYEIHKSKIYQWPVWQRNYWEHIIRDERDLDEIRQYIADNPLQWELDVGAQFIAPVRKRA